MKKMSIPVLGLLIVSVLFITTSCGDEKDIDTDMPVIESTPESSPLNCSVFSRGGSIPVNYVFTDNVALGNFNIEIHHNFDHHTHSTESGDCDLDPVKDPVNPWVYNQDYTIPANCTRYDANLEIRIPDDIDCGDYHFMIRVTDVAGWQQIKSVSIKIVENL